MAESKLADSGRASPRSRRWPTEGDGQGDLRLRIRGAGRRRSTASSFPHRSPRAASPRWMCTQRATAPGVRLVLTKDNAPPQTPVWPGRSAGPLRAREPALNNDEVPLFRFSGRLRRRRYVRAGHRGRRNGARPLRARCPALMICTRRVPPPSTQAASATARRPTVRSAISTAPSPTAPVKIDAIYITPYQNQAPDGAACDDGGVGRPEADRAYVGAADDKPAGRPRPHLQHPQRGCARHHPLHRRRVRQQVAVLFRRDARRNRRPHAEVGR